jgi:hypothetical protein
MYVFDDNLNVAKSLLVAMIKDKNKENNYLFVCLGGLSQSFPPL